MNASPIWKYTDRIATSTVPRTSPGDLTLENHGGWYSVVLFGLLAGYMLFDRAFAHLHIPGTPIFLAEPILAVGLLLLVNSAAGRRLIKYSTPTRGLIGFMAWGLLLSAFWVFEHGIDAVRDSALWYYGLFAIVAGAMTLTDRSLLERLIPAYAGLLGVFAVVGWVRLSMALNEGGLIPDSTVAWTGHRQGNIAIHAAIGFAFAVLIFAPYLAERMERGSAIAWTAALAIPLLVLYLAAGTQNRGGLVAGFFVIVGVPMVARRFGPVMGAVALGLLALFAGLYVSNLSFDLGREGRPLSVRTIIDNIVSVRAGEDTGRSDVFWDPVIDDILSQQHFLTGLGFGEDLSERYDFPDLEELDANPLRNVHNSHLNVLARMGMIGVGFWVFFWATWYYHLFRARARLRMVDSPRRTAFLGWAMLAATAMLTNAFFDGTLESPQVAVWVWSVVGLGAAIAMETNLREWQRRREGAAEIAREGGETNPLELPIRRTARPHRRARRG